MAMGAAVLMKAGSVVGPAVAFERGTNRAQSRVSSVQAAHLVPASFQRPTTRQKPVSQRNVIRAQANSRDASKPGSSGPGEIKRTVEKEVGVHAGKAAPGGKDSPVSDGGTHGSAAGKLSGEDPNSFEFRERNAPIEQSKKREADKLKEVSEAVAGSTSYAGVAQRLRHEGSEPGPVRSEVLERAAPKQEEKQERPFKQPQEEQGLNLNPQAVKKSINFKALAAILVIVFLAFGLAPVWSPIVGKVLTPFFQLVGVAVAIKFFVTDFLRADKRKELYKKGEQLKQDVAGS